MSLISGPGSTQPPVQYVVDVTEHNAEQILLDESTQRLVVVDFWADWCAPCKALMPILEKLAREYQGQFLLAKVNADTQQMIAGQFGIRSLPTVIFMKDGQPVDAFQGAQPEAKIRQMLDKLLPKPWEGLMLQAKAKIEAGDFGGALPLVRQGYEESGRVPPVAMALAHVYLELGRVEDAEPLLKAIPLAARDAGYQQLLAQLELKRVAAKSPAIAALEARLAQAPDDLDLACQLAAQYAEHKHHRDALELLLSVLRKNVNHQDGGAKKLFLDVLAALGKGDKLAVEFQRRFFTLLH